MKKHLILHSTVDMDDAQWLAFRENGVGGSESGAILGLNKYQSSIELFYQKIMPPRAKDENEAMHWGKALEDLISDRWQYWENDPATMIANYKAERIVRRCRRINAYIINPAFPHMFASLDRLINKNGTDQESVLECKTISGYVVDQWESGIPPSYVIQLQQYLTITELNDGEIALLKDGRYMDVLPFKRNDVLCKTIVEKTTEFWQRVTAARDELAKHGLRYFSDDLPDEIKHLVYQFEPSPDGSEAYANFLNSRWTSRGELKKGTDEELNLAFEYNRIKAAIENLEDQAREYSNKLKAEIQDNDGLDFGANGKVTWRTSKNGIRSLRVSVKQLAEPTV